MLNSTVTMVSFRLPHKLSPERELEEINKEKDTSVITYLLCLLVSCVGLITFLRNMTEVIVFASIDRYFCIVSVSCSYFLVAEFVQCFC